MRLLAYENDRLVPDRPPIELLAGGGVRQSQPTSDEQVLHAGAVLCRLLEGGPVDELFRVDYEDIGHSILA